MDKKIQQGMRIQQGLNWLNKEIKKDEIEINLHKEKLIKEIKSIDREKMFSIPPSPPKISFFKKLLIVLGYGKKR